MSPGPGRGREEGAALPPHGPLRAVICRFAAIYTGPSSPSGPPLSIGSFLLGYSLHRCFPASATSYLREGNSYVFVLAPLVHPGKLQACEGKQPSNRPFPNAVES